VNFQYAETLMHEQSLQLLVCPSHEQRVTEHRLSGQSPSLATGIYGFPEVWWGQSQCVGELAGDLEQLFNAHWGRRELSQQVFTSPSDPLQEGIA
jgi:hypothetical protein